MQHEFSLEFPRLKQQHQHIFSDDTLTLQYDLAFDVYFKNKNAYSLISVKIAS